MENEVESLFVTDKYVQIYAFIFSGLGKADTSRC